MKDHANRTNIFGRARMLFMALLMVLTMTATAMSGTDAYAANDTVYVATYDQLRVALEDTPGVKEVVVDPQAAVEKGEVVYGVEDDENSDAFYIGFDGPLTVSHDITITSADDVDVYFARSDSFRRDQGKPALLNIDSTGNLNLDGLITMTGEEVATTFYEADEENPAEFVFSVKSKDGTGEDNEVWNRGQALQGGFYIQNNGGEYTLGDDVIMEDINLADDVEGVEQIHEVEKTTLRSFFSSNKGDEEVVEEEAVEEKVAEEEATQEEEVVVAPTPKKSLKSLKSAPALRNGGTTTDQATNLGNGEWEVSSWRQLKNLFASSDTITTVYITKDIIATPIDGEVDPVDNPVQSGKKYKSILLNGRTGVTIRGPKTGEGTVHIYRDEKDGDFPLFVVQNNNNELTLGEKLILSGKTMTCAKTLDDFASTNLPGQAEPEEHSSGSTKATFTSGGKNLGVTENYLFKWLGFDTPEAAEFEIESDSKIKTKYSNVYYWVDYTSALKQTKQADGTDFEIQNTSGDKVTSVVNGGSYVLYSSSTGYIKGLRQTTNDIKEAMQFTATTTGSSSGTYWTVRGQTTPQYTSKTDANLLAAMKTYNEANTVSGWIIDGENYYTEAEAATALKAYNKKIGLPEQGCDSAKSKTYTSDNFTGGTTINEPKAFFVKVDKGGTLNIQGAILEDFVTDGSVKNAAPITVTGKYSDEKKSTLNMSSGEIRKNTVGYGANEETDSEKSVQELGTLIRDTDPTNTAGAIIFANEAVGNITGTANIESNRADAGAMIITSDAQVTMDADENNKKPTIQKNIGWHHSGAVLVENGGTFRLKDGSINNNVAWWKGGAVWATQFGTIGLVQWTKYPTAMQHSEDVRKNRKHGNFIMTGGELDSNFANARAGALEVESDGVELYGGTISNNRCKSLGGGIYIEGDSPIYSYTLTIKNGFISDNESVAALKDDDLDKKIENGELKPGAEYDTDGKHRDGDWANWGDKHTGDGGGVWLCAMGGTSIFTSNDDDKVIIDNNTASRHGDSADGKNNGWGDDFYISHRHGSALVQNMLGEWYNDTGKVKIDVNDGGVLRGPMGMQNTGKPAEEGGGNYTAADATGIKIIFNKGRNGGGIACNGTIIMGSPADVYRYESEFNIEKKWTGLAERAVNIKLYYQYDVNNDKKIDPETEIFELIQQETGEAYAVQLGTNENIVTNPTGNELIYKTASSKAKASIPAKIMHNGTKISLYEIYNQQSEGKINSENTNDFIDVENEDDLAGLFTYINNRPDVSLRIKWNILVKEEESNEFIRNTDNDVFTVKANTRAGQEITLVNPDNKEDIDSFTVFFDTVEFGQTLENKPKPWFIKGDYLDNSTRITDAEFKLYHAKEDNSTTSSGARVYKADFDEGKGEVVDGVHYSETDNRYYLDITPPETGTDLYLLFETKAHDGYILPKAPWGIKYHADGTYEAFRFNDTAAAAFEAKYKNINILTQEELSKLEILCTEISVPIGADHKINNDKNEPIKLTKVKGTSATNLSTDVKIAGAKFRLYTTTENPNGTWHKSTEVEPKQEMVSDSNGDITLPRAVTRTAGSDIVYWLEETQAAPGYVKNPAPWLIWVSNGNVTHLRYATPSRFDGTKVVRGDDLGGYINLTNLKYIHNEPLEFTKVSAADSNKYLIGAEFEVYKVKDYDKNTYDDKLFGKNSWAIGGYHTFVKGDQVGADVEIKSGANGKFTLPVKESGAYMIFEKTAPKGYVKRESPWLLLILDDGRYQLMQNRSEGNQADFGKADNGNEWWIDHYDKVDGLTLKNDRKPIELTKVDEDGVAVTGGSAQFVITKTKDNDSNGWYVLHGRNVSGSTVTSASETAFGGTAKTVSSDSATGKIIINDLEKGDYLMFETSAPTGFRRATAPWFIHVEDDENGRSWNVYSVKEAYVDKAHMKGSDNNLAAVEVAESDQSAHQRWWPNSWFDKSENASNIVNEPKYLVKVDIGAINKDNATGLEGAVFTLYNTWNPSSGYIRKDENAQKWENLTSDALGRIELDTAITRTPGTYILYENEEPDGYRLSTKPWLIKVDESGNIVVQSTSASRGTTVTLSNGNTKDDCWEISKFTDAATDEANKNRVPNTQLAYKLKKIDGNTLAPLSGAKFVLYNPDSSYWNANDGKYSKYVIGTEAGQTSISDSNGYFALPDAVATAQYGTWMMFEMDEHVPEGYKKATAPWIITKTYERGSYVIRAYYPDDMYATGSNNGTEWPENVYHVCEQGTEIKNYPSVNLKKVDIDSVDLAVNDDNQQVITYGTETVNFLDGVTFKLYEADVSTDGNTWTKKSETPVQVSGSQDGLITSVNGGVVELGSLKKDTSYLLYEESPKADYIKPIAPWRIKIGSDGKIEKLWYPANPEGTEYTDTYHKTYLTNSQKYDLPSAGGIGTYWFMIIGAMMMGFALTAGFTKLNLLKLLRR